MNCPACHSEERSEVVDSRPSDDHIDRRRKCKQCGHRWGTIERTSIITQREQIITQMVKQIMDLDNRGKRCVGALVRALMGP